MKIQMSLLRYMSTLPYARKTEVSELTDVGRWVTAGEDYKVLVPSKNMNMKEMLLKSGTYYRSAMGSIPEYYDYGKIQTIDWDALISGEMLYPAFALSEFDRRLISKKQQHRRWRTLGVYYLFKMPTRTHQALSYKESFLIKRSAYHAINRMWPKATLYVPYEIRRESPPLLWVIDNPLEDPRRNIVGICSTTPYNGETLYEYEIQVPASNQTDAGRGAAEIEALCPIQ